MLQSAKMAFCKACILCLFYILRRYVAIFLIYHYSQSAKLKKCLNVLKHIIYPFRSGTNKYILTLFVDYANNNPN